MSAGAGWGRANDPWPWLRVRFTRVSLKNSWGEEWGYPTEALISLGWGGAPASVFFEAAQMILTTALRYYLNEALARHCLQKPFVSAAPIGVEKHKLWCQPQLSMNLSSATYKTSAPGRGFLR